MKPLPGRPALPAAATVLVAGSDAAQVAALHAALCAALEGLEAAPGDPGLPPLQFQLLVHPPPDAAMAAQVAGARHALLIAGAACPAQARVEDRLRAQLTALRISYAIVPPPPKGVERALSALRGALREPPAGPRWRWLCPDCDDGDCEAHAPVAPRVAPSKT